MKTKMKNSKAMESSSRSMIDFNIPVFLHFIPYPHLLLDKEPEHIDMPV